LAKSTPPESFIKQPRIRWYSYKKERAANVTMKTAKSMVQKSITTAARNNKAQSDLWSFLVYGGIEEVAYPAD
jgi:hypothetical protein